MSLPPPSSGHPPATHYVSFLKMFYLDGFVIALNGSIYPAVVFSRSRLQEWFQHSWLTNTFTKNTMHTPHFQHGMCIFWSCTHYTLLPSYHTESCFTTNPSKTSALLPIIYFQKFREWPGSRQHTRTLRWRRRFPNSTYWMMNIGWQIWYWKEHFVYMKMGYPTMYVNTHALNGIVTLPHIWTT